MASWTAYAFRYDGTLLGTYCVCVYVQMDVCKTTNELWAPHGTAPSSLSQICSCPLPLVSWEALTVVFCSLVFVNQPSKLPCLRRSHMHLCLEDHAQRVLFSMSTTFEFVVQYTACILCAVQYTACILCVVQYTACILCAVQYTACILCVVQYTACMLCAVQYTACILCAVQYTACILCAVQYTACILCAVQYTACILCAVQYTACILCAV